MKTGKSLMDFAAEIAPKAKLKLAGKLHRGKILGREFCRHPPCSRGIGRDGRKGTRIARSSLSFGTERHP